MSNDDVMLSLKKAALVTGTLAAIVSGIGASFTTAAFVRADVIENKRRIETLERWQRDDHELLVRIDENMKALREASKKRNTEE